MQKKNNSSKLQNRSRDRKNLDWIPPEILEINLKVGLRKVNQKIKIFLARFRSKNQK